MAKKWLDSSEKQKEESMSVTNRQAESTTKNNRL